MLPIPADHPVLGSSPAVNYRSAGLPYNDDVQNPKVLSAVLPADVDTSTSTDGSNVFTRGPHVGLFRVWRTQVGVGAFTDLYAIGNHFSSGPDRRVGQRREQAAYNAAMVAALQAADPNAHVVVGGDMNVYPRPDDPFPLAPSDQLAPLYDLGLDALYDTLLAEAPAAAYSYVYDGQAQTLDQIFVTPALKSKLEQIRVAHINADWPEREEARGLSDHDPSVARFQMKATLDGLESLVRYYAQTKEIHGDAQARSLLDRIDRIRAFKEGQDQASRSQLQAFMNQVRGFEPHQIQTSAAVALVHEAELILQSQ